MTVGGQPPGQCQVLDDARRVPAPCRPRPGTVPGRTSCTGRSPSCDPERAAGVPGGPNRYTSVVSMAGCSQRLPAVGHSNRPPTVSRSRRSPTARATSAVGSCGSGRVSASRVTTQSTSLPRCPAAAPTPCLPTRRAVEHRRPRRRRPAGRSRRWRHSTGRRPRSPRPHRTRRRWRRAAERFVRPRRAQGTTTLIVCIGVRIGRTADGNGCGTSEPADGDRTRRRGDRWTPAAAPGETLARVLGDHLGDDLGAGGHRGRPPPGWLEPPTRYRPGRAPAVRGRTNAARLPFDDVP